MNSSFHPVDRIVFLGHCPDRPGLVKQISQFFAAKGANLTNLQQHTERDRFFIRLEGELEEKSPILPWYGEFAAVAREMDMTYEFHPKRRKTKLALLCSKTLHCPLELISRMLIGDINVEISCMISNHQDAEWIAERFGLPFHYLPVTRERRQYEHLQLDILRQYDYDLIVLARYMRILSGEFIASVTTPIINIHHAFLPSFVGKDPYAQAYQRGVKLIGATSHFVTEDLDEGPIISQNVIPVGHEFSIEELKKIGSDIEKRELAYAILKYSENKIIAWRGRTVVFH